MKHRGKKCLSLLLVVAMVLGITPLNNLFKDLKVEAYAAQTTVPSGYIGIYTAQDLNNVRNNLSGQYILMDDIDLSGWGNWNPIGGYSNKFTGIFNGNGHIIRNMTINISTDTVVIYAALFACIGNAEISNFGLVGGSVYAQSANSEANAAGIAAYVDSGSVITNCYNECSITAKTSEPT